LGQYTHLGGLEFSGQDFPKCVFALAGCGLGMCSMFTYLFVSCMHGRFLVKPATLVVVRMKVISDCAKTQAGLNETLIVKTGTTALK